MNKTCPSCHKPLPADAPAGLCPQCLLVGAMATDAKRTGDYAAFEPPTVAELAALFPQLEIIELIGAGGMGAVYKARQPGLDRVVALKVLPRRDEPAFAERFTREARTLAKLNHPGIVGVYDFGQAGGLYYFVMEYVDGVNLRQAGQLNAAEALSVVPQVCTALQFAHDAGVVHRDIKPENILLDAKGRVKIADFGLAKMLGGESSTKPLTHTHQVMGTVHYMAPEQWERPGEVDHRADIYSLGVVFYELLTGELPLGRFPLPSETAQVDVRLDDIVLRTLEKQPERRYQQASDVKTDVERIAAAHDSASFEQVAATRSTESGKRLLIDETDVTARRLQHFTGFSGLLFIVAGLFLSVVPPLSYLPIAIAFGVTGAGLLVVAARVSQQWEVDYLGHIIRFENRVFTSGRLMIDGRVMASGGIGPGAELSTRISSGPGAGDRITSRTSAGLRQFRLQLFVEPVHVASPSTVKQQAERKYRHTDDVKADVEKVVVSRALDTPPGVPVVPADRSRMTRPITVVIAALALGLLAAFVPWAQVQFFGVSIFPLGIQRWHGRVTAPVAGIALVAVAWLAFARIHPRRQMAISAVAGFVLLVVGVAFLVEFWGSPSPQMKVNSITGDPEMGRAAESMLRSMLSDAGGFPREGPFLTILAGALALGVGAVQLRRRETGGVARH